MIHQQGLLVLRSHSRGAQEANNFINKVSFLIQRNHLLHVQIVANEDTIKEHAKTKVGLEVTSKAAKTYILANYFRFFVCVYFFQFPELYIGITRQVLFILWYFRNLKCNGLFILTRFFVFLN